jgi:hypothetical protein
MTLATFQFSKNDVIPQNFLFASWRKEIYAESDLLLRELPNRIPDQFSFALRTKRKSSGMTPVLKFEG